MTQPVYIAFEGPEACGKSTQAHRLAESIGAVLTRETGGTDIGAQLRSILHNVDTIGLDDHAETLIVAADRAQHLAEVVRPALERGEHVVSDRSVYSSLAYQGYGRGLPVDDVRRINEWAIGSTWPDLVILLETDDATLERRMNERELDRIEQAGSDFHRRVREGFAEMAAADPTRWYVIDASTPADETAATIRKVVSERLGI
ncbi:MAG: dTMP kinase [Ilumatobacteraceae bacterium]|nr:dTMP kinase [Actinomycetota bacterium]